MRVDVLISKLENEILMMTLEDDLEYVKQTGKLPGPIERDIRKCSNMSHRAILISRKIDYFLSLVFEEKGDRVGWWRSDDGENLNDMDKGVDISKNFAKKFEKKYKEMLESKN